MTTTTTTTPTPAYLTFGEARNLIPGRRPSTCSLWRWATRGYHGVVLQTVQFGKQRFTTAEWMQEFGEAVAARHTTTTYTPARRPPTPARRRREIAAAYAELAKA